MQQFKSTKQQDSRGKFIFTPIVLLSLATSVIASCGLANFETIIGGYPDHHGLKSIVFDVDVTSGDMVVAGQISKD